MTVYFVQGVEGGPIKIGYTIDVERRLKALQNGSPVRLRALNSADGDRWTERALHDALDEHRLWGEWFEDVVEVETVMAAFCAGAITDSLWDLGKAMRSSVGREFFLDVRLQIATAEIEAMAA